MALVDSCTPWLTDKAYSIHSQYGEDGLIKAIFDRIGTTNRWCFEVGAGDGLSLSNTKSLRNDGWNAILIEQDAVLYDILRGYADDRVDCVNASVDGHTLPDILRFYGAPRDLDFGCIDVDGQDYWLWSGLSEFQPRVMMIEFSPYISDPAFIPDVGAFGQGGRCQAGIDAMRRLGSEKGYTEVAKTNVNLLFVRSGLV